MPHLLTHYSQRFNEAGAASVPLIVETEAQKDHIKGKHPSEGEGWGRGHSVFHVLFLLKHYLFILGFIIIYFLK